MITANKFTILEDVMEEDTAKPSLTSQMEKVSDIFRFSQTCSTVIRSIRGLKMILLHLDLDKISNYVSATSLMIIEMLRSFSKSITSHL